MMTKQKTKTVAGLKLLIIAPLALLLFFIFSCSQEESEPAPPAESMIQSEKMAPTENFKNAEELVEEPVFVVVEEMPTFMGGDINKFRDWIAINVKYPKIAAENGIQGKVFIVFIVDTDGSVIDAEILKGVDPVLDKEALRVVNSSPLWVPGKQSGKIVPVKYSITVNFRLE